MTKTKWHVLWGTNEDDELLASELRFKNQRQKIYGWAGHDWIIGGNLGDLLYGGLGNDTIDGEGGNDQIFGGAGDDELSGDAGNDTANGGAGDDVFWGGLGDDRYFAGPGNDTGQGEEGNDVLYGEAGDDTLIGGSGFDTLNGGPGNDLLDDDGGGDVLTGGAGSDRFQFRNLSTFDCSTVTDFESGIDKLDFRRFFTTPGSGPFRLVTALTGRAGEMMLFHEIRAGAGWRVGGDLDGDRFIDFTLVVHSKNGLRPSDLWL